MKTLYLALAALILGALSCAALGLAEFNTRWRWDVHLEDMTWLTYAGQWPERLWRSFSDPARYVVNAMPVVAILLFHRWLSVQIALLIMVLGLLNSDLRLVAFFEGSIGTRCYACDVSLLNHALAGVVAVLAALVCQACYLLWYLGEQTFRRIEWNSGRTADA